MNKQGTPDAWKDTLPEGRTFGLVCGFMSRFLFTLHLQGQP